MEILAVSGERRIKAYGPMVGTTIIFVISRVFVLLLGYGLDDDAWLIAHAAEIQASGGGYITSCLSGFPSFVPIVGSLFGASVVLGNLPFLSLNPVWYSRCGFPEVSRTGVAL